MRIKTAEFGLVLISIENVDRIIILSYLHPRLKRNYICEFQVTYDQFKPLIL